MLFLLDEHGECDFLALEKNYTSSSVYAAFDLDIKQGIRNIETYKNNAKPGLNMGTRATIHIQQKWFSMENKNNTLGS